jgi:hypothetical protein
MMIQRRFLCFVSIATLLAVFGATLRISYADTFRPVVRGRRGVVVGGQPLSVEAGMRILQRGGNAVDAGVATILAASVIEFSHFSFGGEVPILIKLERPRRGRSRRNGNRAGESYARVLCESRAAAWGRDHCHCT